MKKEPHLLINGVKRFIEHRIQLLEVKGVQEFLKTHHTHYKGTEGASAASEDKGVHTHNRVGKEQFADILEITRNVLQVVLEGAIQVKVSKDPEGDVEMTEENLESICLGEISKILEDRKGWQILESDFSSVAM